MPDEATWDNASAEVQVDPAPPTPEAAPATPDPAPQAEAPTLEKPDAPQVDPELVAARESESQEQITPEPKPEAPKPDDYVAEADDPPEIAALSTAAAKRWAKRQYQDARSVHTFLDFDKPIKEFGDDLFNRSQSRYREHVTDILSQHQDYAAQQLFGMSVDEVKTRLQNGQPNPTTTPTTEARTAATPTTAATLPTEQELAELTNEQVIQRLQQYQTAQQADREGERQRLQTEFQSKVDGLQKQFDAVNTKATTQEQQAQQAEVGQKQTELYNRVWGVVDEVIRTSGLDANPSDPPKIASLKEAARDILSKYNVEAAFDAIEENQKLVKYVYEATIRREFQNAFREEDNLKVRARAAAESVKQSAKMQAILSEIEAYANQSNGKSRAVNPIPPAPGSATGVTIKPPTTWDEAERPIGATA